jgi:hypothetical protein
MKAAPALSASAILLLLTLYVCVDQSTNQIDYNSVSIQTIRPASDTALLAIKHP